MGAGEKTIRIKFTGDTKDLDRATRRAERDISRFGRQVVESVAGGLASLSAKLPGVLGNVVSGLPPQAQAIALAITAGLAVALSSAIGAALSAALLLVAGGGVLALGIKAAIDDPKVTKAFGGLKEKAKKLFDDFGKPFVDPLVRAAKTFSEVLDNIRPQVQRLGRIISPIIDKLAPALGEFLESMLPGIEDAVKASVPLFETLAKHLPKIGDAIGDFFSKISENSDDTTKFFDDLLTAVEVLIREFGVFITTLASWWGAIHTAFAKASQFVLQFAVSVNYQLQRVLDAAVVALGWIPGIGPKLKEAQKKFSEFRISVNNELAKIKDRNVKIIAHVSITGTEKLDQFGHRIGGYRAGGGPVSAGRTYLVGERGPELLTMGSNGYVTPNHQLNTSRNEPMIFVFDLGKGVQTRLEVHDRDLKRRLQAA